MFSPYKEETNQSFKFHASFYSSLHLPPNKLFQNLQQNMHATIAGPSLSIGVQFKLSVNLHEARID